MKTVIRNPLLFLTSSIVFFLPLFASAGIEDPCPSKGTGKTLVVDAKGHSTYKKVQLALDAARPGDTVFVKAGHYPGGIVFKQSGTEGACLRLQGERGAVITGGNFGILIDSKSYISISGFTISDMRKGRFPTAIRVKGAATNISLTKNIVKDIKSSKDAHGISFYGTSQTPMSNLFVDSNEIAYNRLGSSEALVFNGNVMKFQASNNKVHHNDNIGIDIIGHEGKGPKGQDFARDGYILNNQVWKISSRNNPAYTDLSAGGIYVDGGQGIEISGNKVWDCDIGIELASEHKCTSTSGVVARNNQVSGSFQGNIMMGGYDAKRGDSDNITIENNRLSGGREAEIIIQYYTNGISIRKNKFNAKQGRPNIVINGRGNANPLIENNTYASKGNKKDLAHKDGTFQMLLEDRVLASRRARCPQLYKK